MTEHNPDPTITALEKSLKRTREPELREKIKAAIVALKSRKHIR
jgi:hypothetical protein